MIANAGNWGTRADGRSETIMGTRFLHIGRLIVCQITLRSANEELVTCRKGMANYRGMSWRSYSEVLHFDEGPKELEELSKTGMSRV
jgi:hypothetical protein